MCRILCSTGALIGRPNNRNYKLLKDIVPQLSCDGLEFMMYSTWYEEVDELLQTLRELDVPIPVVHCQKSIGESISMGGEENFADAYRRFEINCALAEKLQAKKLVMHLWDGITSDANFENNIQVYPKLKEIAKKHGVDLLIENVVCNRRSPMEHWCELREIYPDIHFIFDTKMAAFHEQLDLLYEEEYAWLWREGHICHYHVNDYGGGFKDWKNLRTLPIGNGHIDFDKFFTHIHHSGYDGTFTVESTAFGAEGTVDIDMLNRQFAYIRKQLEE